MIAVREYNSLEEMHAAHKARMSRTFPKQDVEPIPRPAPAAAQPKREPEAVPHGHLSERVKDLATLGHGPVAIGRMLGASPDHVRAVIRRLRESGVEIARKNRVQFCAGFEPEVATALDVLAEEYGTDQAGLVEAIVSTAVRRKLVRGILG